MTSQPQTRRRPRLETSAGVVLLVVLGFSLALGALDAFRRRDELSPLLPGDVAPAFTLPRYAAAEKLSLESQRGRVVLLDFWATWCPPCLRELPELGRLHDDLQARGFTVLAINREPEDRPKVEAYLRGRPFAFPVLFDTENTGERYRVVSLPMTVLVDRNGRVVRQFMGYTEPDVMRAAVTQALDAP
ncbi:MAG: TlpA family protein disulfide reductase [Deltaproteobacteria bacterium]|nr:TlpA family protein disulfide reductase [Deltaproteobacteria bacterium]